jgi:hypothetical protein
LYLLVTVSQSVHLYWPFTQYIHVYHLCHRWRSRSVSTSVPSDQDLNCSLFDSLGYFWPKCDQCRSRSDGTDVLDDLDLHWSHMHKNVYIWRKGITKY